MADLTRVSRSRWAQVVALVVGVVACGALSAAVGTSPACACTCAPQTPEKIADNAGAIIVGTPISVTRDGMGSRNVVRVVRSYKRRLPETITIVSASPAGACGITLTEGKTQTIVLGWPGGGVTTKEGEWGASLCNNLSSDTSALIAHAGPAFSPIKSTTPRGDSGSSGSSRGYVGIGVAAGAGLLLAGGTALILKRRPG
ncbi:MAG: hypothetical protein WAV90_23755 [Gordonia amarae]